MAILGALTDANSDHKFVGQFGQDVIFSAINEYFARFSTAMTDALGIFVAGDTTNHKLRHYVPGVIEMESMGRQAAPSNAKTDNSYDVAFWLKGYGKSMGWNDVDLAYMPIAQVQGQVKSVTSSYLRATRRLLMARIFDNNQRTFGDPVYGDLDVEPLANSDAVEYAPLVGTTALTTDDHYLASGYTTGNISDANDPSSTLRDELLEHTGYTSGGNDIAFVADETVCDAMVDLTDFQSVGDYAVELGADTDELRASVSGIPGRLRGRINSNWVSEWRWMPADYIIAVNMETEAPLLRRVDEPGVGLGNGGLQLIAQYENTPLAGSIWRARFGFGTKNRTAAAVMKLTAGAYDIPSGYELYF